MVPQRGCIISNPHHGPSRGVYWYQYPNRHLYQTSNKGELYLDNVAQRGVAYSIGKSNESTWQHLKWCCNAWEARHLFWSNSCTCYVSKLTYIPIIVLFRFFILSSITINDILWRIPCYPWILRWYNIPHLDYICGCVFRALWLISREQFQNEDLFVIKV